MYFAQFYTLIISILSTYTQGFTEFEIVVQDIFDFMVRFGLRLFLLLWAFHNMKKLR